MSPRNLYTSDDGRADEVTVIVWLLAIASAAFFFLALHIDPRDMFLLVLPTWGVR